MKPLSSDTPLDVERLWITGLQEKGLLWCLCSSPMAEALVLPLWYVY